MDTITITLELTIPAAHSLDRLIAVVRDLRGQAAAYGLSLDVPDGPLAKLLRFSESATPAPPPAAGDVIAPAQA